MSANGEDITLGESRTQLLKEAFGDKYDAVEKLEQKKLKAEFDAHKRRLESLKPIWKERQTLFKTIPNFWSKAIDNHGPLASRVDAVDVDALAYLEDVWVEHLDDPRDYDITLSFKSGNPYFSEKTLVKKIRKDPLPGSVIEKDEKPTKAEENSLDYDLYTEPTKISWASDAHNLQKKAPGSDPTKLEEYDEFSGFGSIFNWFASGSDAAMSADLFVELFEDATEAYANLLVDSPDLVELDDDDEDEDDEDPTAEIDLEERDKKRQKRA